MRCLQGEQSGRDLVLLAASPRRGRPVPIDTALVVTALVVYVASWAGWLNSTQAWGRDWGAKSRGEVVEMLLGWMKKRSA